ncbi:MAG: hypothetical protein AAGE84_20385 [Cyanobacteria bacterium P01_G01_bin.39]
MASESPSTTDRQQRIREHLAKSSGGEIDFQRSPQNYNPAQQPAPQSSTSKSRQEHIERSKGNYNLNSGNRQERKSRIMSHVRITRG